MEGRALLALDRPDEAARRFRDLLELRLNDDEPGAILKSRRRTPPAGQANSNANPAALVEMIGPRHLVRAVEVARGVFGLEPGSIYSGSSLSLAPDFGQARVMALAALLAKARSDDDEAGWLARRKEGRDKAPVAPRALRDVYYLVMLRLEPVETFEVALALASGRDPAVDYLLLYAVMNRNNTPGVSTRAAAASGLDDPSPPLPPADLDLVRDAFLSLVGTAPAQLYGGLVIGAVDELKKAGKLDEVEGIYRELVASATTLDAYSAVGWIAAQRGDLDGLRELSRAFYRPPASAQSAV
jgi:hypothetical protein